MYVTLSEKQELIRLHRDKAWAHILKLEQSRGRNLNANQIRCMNIVLGVTS